MKKSLIVKYSKKKYGLTKSQVEKLVGLIMARKPIWGYMRCLGIKGHWKKPKPRMREGRRNMNVRPKRRRNLKIQLV